MGAERILLGVVGRPHGVRGLVHVTSYTAEPSALASYGPLHDDQGRPWTLEWRAPGVAALRDASGQVVNDRTAAQALTNTRLHIDRGRLPPADEDEFYLSDLVGLQAVAPDGTTLGQVTVVHDYGAGTSLEIKGPRLLIVPFTRACVPDVDIAAGRLTVVPPAEVVVEGAADDDEVTVMPGLVPGIHVGGPDQPTPQAAQAHTPHQQSPRHDVDGRNTPGHDDGAGRAAPTGHAANQPVLRGPLPGAHADASGDDDLGPVP